MWRARWQFCVTIVTQNCKGSFPTPGARGPGEEKQGFAAGGGKALRG
jgi:hypothetical protein